MKIQGKTRSTFDTSDSDESHGEREGESAGRDREQGGLRERERGGGGGR